MMYIRTKDGRIIDPSKIATGSKYMDFDTNDESFRKIFKTEPLSKSENLEELCDEFVIVPRADYEKNYIAYGLDREFLYESVCEHNRNHKGCYGAIWTEWGLKYVAKMNENGELELI